MAGRAASERALTFASVADVAGAMPDAVCAPRRPVPAIFFQGTDDDELRFDLLHLRRRDGRGHRSALSIKNALRFWGRHDGCARGAVVEQTAHYTRQRAAGCPAGQAAELYTVHGHPHAWPGGRPTWLLAPRPAPDVAASDIILDFFQRTHHAADAARTAVTHGGRSEAPSPR